MKPLIKYRGGKFNEISNIEKHTQTSPAISSTAQEREKIMNMTHQEALRELIKIRKIESKIKTIKNVIDNELFSVR
jgi:site-specific DNA-adenine methylase